MVKKEIVKLNERVDKLEIDVKAIKEFIEKNYSKIKLKRKHEVT